MPLSSNPTQPAAVPSRFHRLTIREVRRETQDAVSIAFALPADSRHLFDYSAGQYLTLRTDIGGQEVRRSYSICSGLDEGELRVAIKRIEGGVFSCFANQALKAGDAIDVMPPMGRFSIEPRPESTRTYLGLACGSGITPILSIIKTTLAREPNSRFFLFYGNRSTGSILFREALEDLKDRFLDRLSVSHVLSREAQDIPVLNGRLDGKKIALLLKAVSTAGFSADQIDHAFLCGPAGMLDEADATLLRLGIAPERIHIERFTPAGDGKPPAETPMPARPEPMAIAALILDGVRTEIPVADDEAVLEAALRAGLDLPYSCRGGMCCTCRAKVVEGRVEMAVNYSLEPWELAAGYVLTCQARPTTPRVVIDYDQV